MLLPRRVTPGKDLVPILQVAGWSTGLVWAGAENVAPHRDLFPDRPPCNKSL